MNETPWFCLNDCLSLPVIAFCFLILFYGCVHFRLQFARSQLLGFMFKHGHYSDACMLFFPPNGVPSAPTSPILGLSNSASSTPQRPDPLATEYGTVDDLCELCIAYGVMSVLENVVSTRMTSSGDPVVSQHTVASLIRICAYCETHRHFNYLYKFQVIIYLCPLSLISFFMAYPTYPLFLSFVFLSKCLHMIIQVIS